MCFTSFNIFPRNGKCILKGGLISESFSLSGSNLQKKGAKSLFRFIVQAKGSDLAFIFGDLSQSEKLSEIKPPLEIIEIVACNKI